jgi:murein L,D-transpeptidase YcbB/YkuD
MASMGSSNVIVFIVVIGKNFSGDSNKKFKDPGGPAYLQEKNMKLVDSATGKEVDPSTIDWASMTTRKFHYQVVQRPSPDNALGQAKFIFPNPHFVFLHDTNHREHFDDQVRTFSSGCIRIEYPMEFARLVLDGQPGYR